MRGWVAAEVPAYRMYASSSLQMQNPDQIATAEVVTAVVSQLMGVVR